MVLFYYRNVDSFEISFPLAVLNLNVIRFAVAFQRLQLLKIPKWK